MLRRLAAAAVALAGFLAPSLALAGEDVVACVKAAEDAQTDRSAHRLLAAREGLLECAQAGCPSVVRNDCAFWLSEVDKLLPTVVIEARDAAGADLIDVHVTVDGNTLTDRLDGLALPLDPGIRVFRFATAGAEPVEQQVVIREGEKGRPIVVALAVAPPVAPPGQELPVSAHEHAGKGVPVASFVLAGVGLLGIASFSYFAIKGRSEAADLEGTCGRDKSCSEGQVAPIRRELLVADISLGVAVVSLGTAAYLFLTRDQDSAAPVRGSNVKADVSLGPRQGLFTLSGRF